MFGSRRASSELLPLYTSLENHLRHDKFEDALSVIDSILSKKSDEFEAFKCKIYCLIQLKQLDHAERLIKSNMFTDNNLDLERGFVLYLKRDFAQTWSVIKDLLISAVSSPHLKAQTLYQLGDASAATLYNNILRNSNEVTVEQVTNLLAAASICTEKVRSDLNLGVYDKLISTSYDCLYNTSFFHANDHKWSLALKSLKKSKNILLSSNQQDALQSQELWLIKSQKAYIYQKLAMFEKAKKIYNSIPIEQLDATSKLIISWNVRLIDCYKSNANFVDFFNSSPPLDTLKLSVRQQCEFYANHAFSLIHSSHNVEQITKIAQTIQTLDPKCPLSSVIRASVMIKNDADSSAALSYLRMCPHSESEYVRLLIAHIYLTLDRHNECIKTLESITQLQKCPAVIATILNLYDRTGNRIGAIKMLERLLKSLDKYSNQELYSSLLFCLSQFKPNSSTWHLIVKEIMGMEHCFFEENPGILCKLIRALCQIDPESAKLYKLPELPDADGVQLDDLETAADITFSRERRVATNAKSTSRVTRRKRKNKPPKQLDPNYVPDPERWIKKKNRKKQQAPGFGHQGSNIPANPKVATVPIPKSKEMMQKFANRVDSRKNRGKKR